MQSPHQQNLKPHKCTVGLAQSHVNGVVSSFLVKEDDDLVDISRYFNYCPVCGQPINWKKIKNPDIEVEGVGRLLILDTEHSDEPVPVSGVYETEDQQLLLIGEHPFRTITVQEDSIPDE